MNFRDVDVSSYFIAATIAAINISYLLAQKSATDTTGLLYAPISCLHHKIHCRDEFTPILKGQRETVMYL